MSNSESILRIYNCTFCKTTHQVMLPKNLAEKRDRYPFAYCFLHSSKSGVKDLLTMLYLDAQLQVRGTEIMEVEDGIFPEELARELAEKLTDKIMELEDENYRLKQTLAKHNLSESGEKLSEIKEIISSAPKKEKEVINIYILSLIDGEQRFDMKIDTFEKIINIKSDVSNIFGLFDTDFHLSFEGIILDENSIIKEYKIANGDELVLVPAQNFRYIS